jgi:hypothetical protein
MSDTRFEPPRPLPDDDYQFGMWDWMPIAVALVIIAAIVVFALVFSRNTQQASTDPPAISTDTTTGQSPPRQERPNPRSN